MPKINGVNYDRLASLSLGGGRDFFNFPKGEYGKEYVLRVLPGCGKMGELFFTEGHMHYNGLGNENSGFQYKGRSRAIYSITEHASGRDPIQEILDWAEENDEGTVERGLRRSSQYFMNVIDRSDGKVKVWGAPKTVITEIQTLSKNARYKDLLDLKKGRDFSITRTKKGKGPVNYTVIPLDACPVGVDNLEDKMKDCTELITPFTTDEVFAILWENVADLIPLDEIFPDVNFEALHTKYYTEEEEEQKPRGAARRSGGAKSTAKAGAKGKAKVKGGKK